MPASHRRPTPRLVSFWPAPVLTFWIAQQANLYRGIDRGDKNLLHERVFLAGAWFLTVAMGLAGIRRGPAEWIGGRQPSAYTLLAALAVFFIIIGMFLDGISVAVLATSVVMPMAQQTAIGPLWFGVFLVIVVEISQITPPVGFNLFVLRSLTGRNILVIARAALPFFVLMIIASAIIVAVAGIVTCLPDKYVEFRAVCGNSIFDRSACQPSAILLSKHAGLPDTRL